MNRTARISGRLITFLHISFIAISFLPLALLGDEKATSRPAAEWNYDVYRKTYPEQVSTVHTSQSGNEFMEPAQQFCRSGERPTKSQRELSRRILLAWRDLLGPSKRNTGPLKARVLETKDFPNYTRQKVEYEADPGEPVHAWLFIPKNLKGKAPAMLCLHQTVQEGKDQAAGLTTSPELAFGPLLAERGYVTLCPDAICFGERYQVGGSFYCHYGDAVRIYQGNAGRSIMSKMIDDAMRAVDYLVSRPEVDKKRIGSIGHSHGGYGTLFAMAYDERIKAGVVSCGFTSFRADPTPDRWYRRTALIPRLGGFEGRMNETPVDFHQLFAAIAPRALFISAAMKDSIFPGVGDVNWMRENVDEIYESLKSPSAFELYAFDGAHAFTPEARDRAWKFLNTHLHHNVK
ncbi:MAG: alpha/beta fold hydrolase [Verrucomicrobiales bacterium]|nr:alpha/beta fold hydrolase [Verrucomicrobiales bacterium]